MTSKLLALVLALCVLMSLACGASAAMTAGTYSATVSGMHGPMTVQVTVSEDKIESVEVTENVETPGLIDWPMREIPQEVVENQSVNVDTVTGVTVSSRAILSGVSKALEEAGANLDDFNKPVEKEAAPDEELTADVIIVGGGGAGLARPLRRPTRARASSSSKRPASSAATPSFPAAFTIAPIRRFRITRISPAVWIP